MKNRIINKLNRKEPEISRRQLKYIYRYIIDRKLTKIIETAILNTFVAIIDKNDYNYLKFFESLLTDTASNSDKNYHLRIFKEL